METNPLDKLWQQAIDAANKGDFPTVLFLLGSLAEKFYGDRGKWKRIHEANVDKIEHPDRIYLGQSLHIPLD